MGVLKIKRVYAATEASDGYRILIDRLWPRGLSKERAAIDEWAKDIAPSPELRKWFGHKEEHFEAFDKAYDAELNVNPEIGSFAHHCKDLLTKKNVTLVYGARSETCNHAIVLLNKLNALMRKSKE